MNDITIIKQDATKDGWEFTVAVDDTEFNVKVEKAYWQEITNGIENVEELVRHSFEFLLEREPKKAILHRFNLRDIEKYFPEYPRDILSTQKD